MTGITPRPPAPVPPGAGAAPAQGSGAHAAARAGRLDGEAVHLDDAPPLLGASDYDALSAELSVALPPGGEAQRLARARERGMQMTDIVFDGGTDMQGREPAAAGPAAPARAHAAAAIGASASPAELARTMAMLEQWTAALQGQVKGRPLSPAEYSAVLADLDTLLGDDGDDPRPGAGPGQPEKFASLVAVMNAFMTEGLDAADVGRLATTLGAATSPERIALVQAIRGFADAVGPNAFVSTAQRDAVTRALTQALNDAVAHAKDTLQP